MPLLGLLRERLRRGAWVFRPHAVSHGAVPERPVLEEHALVAGRPATRIRPSRHTLQAPAACWAPYSRGVARGLVLARCSRILRSTAACGRPNTEPLLCLGPCARGREEIEGALVGCHGGRPKALHEGGNTYVLPYQCTALCALKMGVSKLFQAGPFERVVVSCMMRARDVPDVVRADHGAEMTSRVSQDSLALCGVAHQMSIVGAAIHCAHLPAPYGV